MNDSQLAQCGAKAERFPLRISPMVLRQWVRAIDVYIFLDINACAPFSHFINVIDILGLELVSK